MRRQRHCNTLAALMAALLACACTGDGDSRGIASQGRLTVPNVPGLWTYVSLRQGQVVGTCALNDTVTQREWAERTDWDLAIGNGMMRTNGGASGKGQGGVAIVATPYDETDAQQPATYQEDRDTLQVW